MYVSTVFACFFLVVFNQTNVFNISILLYIFNIIGGCEVAELVKFD